MALNGRDFQLVPTHKLLPVSEVARRLRRSPTLIYRWISDGRLRGQKYGYAVLVEERELARFQKNAPERRGGGGRRDKSKR
jgi:excisionase family DNA binding protein